MKEPMSGDCSKARDQRGFAVLLVSMFLCVILGFMGFALDLARVYDQRQQMQIAADAASLAAVNVLGSGVSYSSVLATITAVAEANSVMLEEITEVMPLCGAWADGQFYPQSAGVCDQSATAVRVTIRRAVPQGFFSFLRTAGTTLVANATSYKPLNSPGNCIRPFGVESSYLTNLNLQQGATFTISGTQGAGNWGKIDLDGNSSSGEQYTSLMLSNLCDEAIAAGNDVSVGTGNAQIRQVFDTLLMDSSSPYAYQGMVFAVTTDFPAGNGVVTILKFIRVDLVSQRGNGQGWQGTFRLVDADAEPDSQESPKRQLMQ
jgi:Flp pilus assembly protein TadG